MMYIMKCLKMQGLYTKNQLTGNFFRMQQDS